MYIDAKIRIPEAPKPEMVEKSEQKPKKHVSDFESEANTCYKAIIHSSGLGLSMSERYQCLDTLRNSVREVKVHYPEEFKQTDLKTLVSNIRSTRKDLRRAFETDSHWLVQTMQGRHMKPMKPEIGKAPSVKLSLNNITGSLDNIAGLKLPIDKIRALQHLNTMVTKKLAEVEEALLSSEGKGGPLVAKRKYLRNALEMITRFGDEYISFEDKISLLFQINLWDGGDLDQHAELKSLVDKYGRNFATHFFNKEGMTLPLLFGSLKLLLKAVHRKNPSLTLLQIVQKWPQSIKMEGVDVESLLAMSDDPGFLKDPTACTVRDYLLNCIDFDGSLRFKLLQKQLKQKQLSTGEYYKRVGQLIYMLERSGRTAEHITKQCTPTKQKPKEATPYPKLLSVLKGKIGGRNVGHALSQLSRTLRFHTYSSYLRLVENDASDISERFSQLSKDIGSHGEQLKTCVRDLVRAEENEHERVCLIANFMHLARMQAASGNFYSAFCIMNGLEQTNYDPDLKASWKKYLTLKSAKDFSFLETLFDCFKNFKNYRTHFAALEHHGTLCIPMLSVLKGELDKDTQMASQNLDTTLTELKALLTAAEFDMVCKRLYLGLDNGKKEDPDWAIRHSLDDIQKFLQVLDQVDIDKSTLESVKKLVYRYIETRKNAEAGFERYNSTILSLSFAIQTQLAYNPMPEASICTDFIELIEKEEIAE